MNRKFHMGSTCEKWLLSQIARFEPVDRRGGIPDVDEKPNADERIKAREGLKLGGVITTVVGVGVFVFLSSIGSEAAYAGVIPLSRGRALLAKRLKELR